MRFSFPDPNFSSIEFTKTNAGRSDPPADKVGAITGWASAGSVIVIIVTVYRVDRTQSLCRSRNDSQ
jgi:hypothetical protein